MLSRDSKVKANYTFDKESQIVDSLKAGEEKAVTFKFDINISAPVNKQDTIDFMISSDNGVMLKKTFVIKYCSTKGICIRVKIIQTHLIQPQK